MSTKGCRLILSHYQNAKGTDDCLAGPVHAIELRTISAEEHSRIQRRPTPETYGKSELERRSDFEKDIKRRQSWPPCDANSTPGTERRRIGAT